MQSGISQSRSLTWVAITVLAAVMAVGCSDDESQSDSSDSGSPSMIEREAPRGERTAGTPTADNQQEPEFNVMPEVEGSLEEEGLGLDTVINAGSKEDYAQSLQWIAEDTSREQFERLETSIRFIHMYDSNVYGNESALFGVIDGMTGNEIITYADAMIQQRRDQREQAASPVAVPQPDGG